MLHELDKTLEKLIYERGNILRDQVDISFEQPSSEWSSRLSRPTVNCWCFSLTENIKLRQKDLRINHNVRAQFPNGVERGKNGEVPRAKLELPPLRMDLTYLVTAWAREIEDEHQLLWRALGAFAQIPFLEPEDCEGESIKEQPYNIPLVLAQIGEGMATFTDIWSVLDNQMRLSFTLTATLALDTGRGFEAPLTFDPTFVFGQSGRPDKSRMDTRDMVLKYQRPVDGEQKKGRRFVQRDEDVIEVEDDEDHGRLR